METEERTAELKSSVDRFIFRWHEFPFDFWWRKKYHVPFGSAIHREMSFIDMYVEWREDLIMNRSLEEQYDGWTEEDEKALGLKSDDTTVVKMTQEQIEEDYENLDLESFDEK